MLVEYKIVKKDNGLWYGYYNDVLIADGYATKWGAKRRVKQYHKTGLNYIKQEIFTLQKEDLT